MKAIIRMALIACAAVALTLPSCESDGNFTVLGYTTKPNYDCGIHTVRVPIFVNHTVWRGIEFDLTRALVREIEAKTPYKVVGADANADTELTGEIMAFTKGTLNVNPLNEIREQQTTLTVAVVWRDLRTGVYLSDSSRRPGTGPAPVLPALPGTTQLAIAPGAIAPGVISPPTNPGDGRATLGRETTPPTASNGFPAPLVNGPNGQPVPPAIGPDGLPLPPTVPPSAKVTITSLGDFIPELGQSLATAQQQNVDRMAVQIVAMMEKPW